MSGGFQRLQYAKPKHVFKDDFKYEHYECRDRGVVFAVLNDLPDGYFAFRCWCNIGRADKRRFQRWQDAQKTGQYTLV